MSQIVAGPLEVPVNEYDWDVDTGVYIKPNNRVIINAWGAIWAGVWFTGNNGPEGWVNWEAGPDSPLPYAAPFQLLGRLSGRYFEVGTGRQFTYVEPESKLYLRINDNWPGNGWGAFWARVEVWDDSI